VNRFVAVVVAIALIVALSIWATTRGPQIERNTAEPTTYSSGDAGTLGLYLVLDKLGITVTRSRSDLARAPEDGVLWTLSTAPLTAVSAHALEARVRQGGTVVLPSEPARALLEALEIPNLNVHFTSGTLMFEGGQVPGVATQLLTGMPAPEQVWAKLADEPAIALWKVAGGRVVVVGDLSMLRNHELRRLEVARVVMSLVQSLGTVHHFDETRTGYGSANLWLLLSTAPWRWGLVQLIVALLVTLVVVGTRRAPSLDAAITRRRDARAHVEAVARLWQTRGDAGLPLDTLLRGLDARAAKSGARAGGEPPFLAWVRWRRPDRIEQAHAMWQRAEALRTFPNPRAREVVAVAGALRTLEQEVFGAG
jgi:hypothetical protein